MKNQNKSAYAVIVLGTAMCAVGEFVPGWAEASPLWAPMAVMVLFTGMFTVAWNKGKEKEAEK